MSATQAWMSLLITVCVLAIATALASAIEQAAGIRHATFTHNGLPVDGPFVMEGPFELCVVGYTILGRSTGPQCQVYRVQPDAEPGDTATLCAVLNERPFCVQGRVR